MDIISLTIPLTILYVIIILIGRLTNIRLTLWWTTILKKLLIWLICSICVLIILSVFNIYIRGYWTTKIIIWLFLILCLVLYGYGERKSLHPLLKFATTIVTYTTLLFVIIVFALGFGGQILYSKILDKVAGSTSFIFYDDNEIRIERDNTGFRNRRSPKLFRKRALFEIRSGNIYGCTHLPDSIRVKKTKDSIIVFCFDKDYGSSSMNSNPNVITIRR